MYSIFILEKMDTCYIVVNSLILLIYIHLSLYLTKRIATGLYANKNSVTAIVAWLDKTNPQNLA